MGYRSAWILTQWPLVGLLAEYNSPFRRRSGHLSRVNTRDLAKSRASVSTARHHFLSGSPLCVTRVIPCSHQLVVMRLPS